MTVKNKGGRPPHEPTPKDRKFVKLLAGYGIEQAKIAEALGITAPTLRRAYKAELRQAKAAIEGYLVGRLHRLARDKTGSTAFRAVEFLLTMRFGWSRYAPPPAPKPAKGEGKTGKKDQEREAAAQPPNRETPWCNLLN